MLDILSGNSDEVFVSLKNEISTKKVIIFGAGTGGKILSNVFKIYDIEIGYLVDNDMKKWNTSLYNIYVQNPEELHNEDKLNIIIFVASIYYDDISKQLSSFGLFEHVHFYDGMKLIEFLRTNPRINYSVLDDFRIWLDNGRKIDKDQRKVRPCHLSGLFIREDGYLFPCCRLRGNESFKIGHLSDNDLYEKIKNYESECSCTIYKLRKIGADEEISFNYISIEFSLLCQAQCAMCCVGAPENMSPYKYYKEMEKLINVLNPRELSVQGGEVLIQEDTMNFLKNIKRTHPGIKIAVVSNAGYDVSRVDIVEAVFDYMHVSMVGFQNETYKRIMGLNIKKTIDFIDALMERGKVSVILKYLITPLNVHEAGLFLNWAIQRKPSGISIADSNIDQYINYKTWDEFWNKILARTALEVKRELIQCKEFLLLNNIKVGFDSSSRRIYDISDSFIQENGLENVIDIQ